MTTGQLWVLIGLGVFHGVNPGMGWLLAVSRGLQERSRAALLWSLGPIAGGHAASIAAVAVVISATGSSAAARWLPTAGGAVIVTAGLWALFRGHRHAGRATEVVAGGSANGSGRPASVAEPAPGERIRMSLWHLGGWSFLMSSAHGAGLMLLPVLAGSMADGPGAPGGAHAHAATAPAPAPEPVASATWTLPDATVLGLAATGVHTVAMFAAAGVCALIAYDFAGVHVLRRRWLDMDRIWALALIAAGLFVLWTAP